MLCGVLAYGHSQDDLSGGFEFAHPENLVPGKRPGVLDLSLGEAIPGRDSRVLCLRCAVPTSEL